MIVNVLGEEALADVMVYLETLRALIQAAETNSIPSPSPIPMTFCRIIAGAPIVYWSWPHRRDARCFHLSEEAW
jgi:hypothetical protein